MMMNKRTFSKEEKLLIVKEASEQGVKIVLEKYDIYPATYYSWKNKLEEIGVDYEVIKGMADWADKKWTNPATDWHSWDPRKN